ncbi:Hypothetical Protein XCAW_03379 [Xanthomonas citri subsp. citri Aw12879]|nr:Hypothetical Protein XCAW_03379 [Xanthomonas citri subsp. citri Aw12879]
MDDRTARGCASVNETGQCGEWGQPDGSFFGTPALAGAMRPTSRYKRLALKPFFHRQKMARSAG